MDSLFHVMAEMESACDSEAALLEFHLPDLASLINSAKTLPVNLQLELRDRLERIQVIMEGQMLLYATETEHLREVIRNARRTPKPRDPNDRTVALIKIPEPNFENVPTTLQ